MMLRLGFRSCWDVAITVLLFLGLFLSSGAVDLLKDGGARSEGVSNAVPYEGFLNYLSVLWSAAVFLLFFSYLIKKRARLLRVPASVFLLFVFSAASIFWSVSAVDSFKNLVAIISFYLLVSAHVGVFGKEGAIDRVADVMLLIGVACYFYIIFLPGYGVSVGRHEGVWQGVFPHKNTLGLFSVAAFIFCVFRPWSSRVVAILGGGAFLGLAIFSGAYTSIASLAVVLLFWFSGRVLAIFGGRPPYLMAIMLSFAISIMAVCVSVFSVSFSVFGKDTSFSSRSLIWKYALGEIGERPVYGHGLSVFHTLAETKSDEVVGAIGEAVGSTHNGFLDAMFSFGVFGLFLVVFMVASGFMVNRKRPLEMMGTLFLIFFIIGNTFESNLFSFNFIIFLFFYLAAPSHRLASS